MGEAPERRDEALLGSRPASATLPACPPRGKLCCACRTLPTLVAILPPLSVPLKCDLVTNPCGPTSSGTLAQAAGLVDQKHV
jgi:hypothetical protein